MKGALKLQVLAAVTVLPDAADKDFHHVQGRPAVGHVFRELALFFRLDLIGRLTNGGGKVFRDVAGAVKGRDNR